jgi:hypothetical protein
VLDDATIDRVEQVHTEQMDYVEIYTQQISRWRKAKPSAAQARELDRMDSQNQQLRALTADVLALASELREGTIERVLGMSDLELVSDTSSASNPQTAAKPTHNIACNTLTYVFARMGLPPRVGLRSGPSFGWPAISGYRAGRTDHPVRIGRVVCRSAERWILDRRSTRSRMWCRTGRGQSGCLTRST